MKNLLAIAAFSLFTISLMNAQTPPPIVKKGAAPAAAEQNTGAAPIVKKGADAPAQAGAAPIVKKTGAPTTPAPAAKKGKAPKPVTGTVCSLVGAAEGKMKSLGKDEAQKMASRGEILCLCSGKKVFIVVNADGTNASAKLAEAAGGNVNVTGKTLNKGGVNVILADGISK